MAVTITRTPWIDDDGSGTTGTVLNNAIKTELYNQIDAALAGVAPIVSSFTPVIGGDGGATSGQTYSYQQGVYVKVGALVHLSFFCALSAKGTIAGNLEIQGLPYPVESTSTIFATPGVVSWYALATSYVAMSLEVPGSTATAARLYGITAAAPNLRVQYLTTANLANNSQLIGSIAYRTAA